MIQCTSHTSIETERAVQSTISSAEGPSTDASSSSAAVVAIVGIIGWTTVRHFFTLFLIH